MTHATFRQRGVTMIEVLVAVLVLSVGLLGVANALVKSSSYATGAWAQSAVATGLSDMAERLRTSPNAVNANFTLTTNYPDQRSAMTAGTVAPSKDCDSTTCTPAETAAFHIADWRLALDRSLPGSAGWIKPLSSSATGSSATSFEIAVMWFDKSNLSTSGSAAAALACTGSETGPDQRRCCPAAASAAAGVRCTRMILVP